MFQMDLYFENHVCEEKSLLETTITLLKTWTLPDMCVNCTFENNSLTCHLNQFLEFQIGETGHTTVLSGTRQLAAKQSHVLQNWMPTSLLLNRNVRNTLLAHLTSPSADRTSNVAGTSAISTRRHWQAVVTNFPLPFFETKKERRKIQHNTSTCSAKTSG